MDLTLHTDWSLCYQCQQTYDPQILRSYVFLQSSTEKEA